MSDSLTDALDANGIDPAAVPHAMRYFVSAWSNDLPPTEMRARLIEQGLAPQAIDDAVGRLEQDAAQMEAASLAVLQAGFDVPDSAQLASGAIGAAKAKLPVVEAGLLAIVAVYGMWLARTKGRRSHQRVVRQGSDGSWEEIETTQWYGPSGPLRAIGNLLGLRAPVEDQQLPEGEEARLPPPSEA